MSYPWEEVHVPAGSYIGWGNWPGQYAIGVVLAYGPNDGTTQKGDACPETTLELIEPAASFDKQGNRTDYQAGAIVQITHSQVSSKKAALAAGAVPGDLVKYTLTEYLVGQGKEGGDVKVFGVNIVRGFRPVQRPAPQQAPQFGPPNGNGAPQFGPPAQTAVPQFGVGAGGPPPQQAPQQAPQFGPQGVAGPQGSPYPPSAPAGANGPSGPIPPQFGSPSYPLPPEPPQFGQQAPPQQPQFAGVDPDAPPF